MTMRADGTPISIKQNQRWFDDDNIPLQHINARTSNIGQDLVSIINSATEVIEMKINFNDQHCFEEVILNLQDMIEKLPEHIISNPAHQKTLVKNLLPNLKVNRLIYDRMMQSNLNTVTEFNRYLLKVGSRAIDCVKEHKTLIGSTNSPLHNPASSKKQTTSTSPYRTTVNGAS